MNKECCKSCCEYDFDGKGKCFNPSCDCHVTVKSNFVNSMTPEELKESLEMSARAVLTTTSPTVEKAPSAIPVGHAPDSHFAPVENWHKIVGPNGMCECGTEKGTCGEQLEKKLRAGAKQFSKDFTGVIQELAEEEAVESWEKEFEEVAQHSYDDADFSYMRTFIRDLLAKRDKEVAEKIVDYVRKNLFDTRPEDFEKLLDAAKSSYLK